MIDNHIIDWENTKVIDKETERYTLSNGTVPVVFFAAILPILNGS